MAGTSAGRSVQIADRSRMASSYTLVTIPVAAAAAVASSGVDRCAMAASAALEAE